MNYKIYEIVVELETTYLRNTYEFTIKWWIFRALTRETYLARTTITSPLCSQIILIHIQTTTQFAKKNINTITPFTRSFFQSQHHNQPPTLSTHLTSYYPHATSHCDDVYFNNAFWLFTSYAFWFLFFSFCKEPSSGNHIINTKKLRNVCWNLRLNI